MSPRTTRGAKSEGRMSLGRHLLELRKRLFISALAILLMSIAGWFVSDPILGAIQAPITAMSKSHQATINFAGIGTAFDVRLQIAFTVGAVVSSPVWLYQVFAFLVPGLTGKERRYTFGFFFTAVPLFLCGCAAGWYIFPHIVGVLGSFVPTGSANLIEARDYLSFVLKLVLAVGIAFVLPVFLVLLNFLSILSAASIIRSWRWAILLIFVFCAVATPSADVGSMFLLSIPMIILFLLAAAVAGWHDRIVRKRADVLTRDLDGATTA